MSRTEKSKIVQRIHNKVSTLEIAKELDRDHRTMKNFVTNPELCNGRFDKGKIRKKAHVLHRAMRRTRREVCRNPLETSKKVFDNAGVPDMPKSTRCRILRTVAKCGKPEVRPLLKDIHKKKRTEWARNHMKVNFQTVLFTGECRATRWVGERMVYVSTGSGVNQEVVVWCFGLQSLVSRRWSENDHREFIDFIGEYVEPWHKKNNLSSRKKMLFMHDNAPSHVARITTEYLESVFARHGKTMQWPAGSPNLNPIENLWSILKRKIYSRGRQYTSKDDLWNAVLTAAKEISSDEIECLTSSMDQRLFSLVDKNGNYIQYWLYY